MKNLTLFRCFRYHKGTDFQANHNKRNGRACNLRLFQIPQRYRFSSKSQHIRAQASLNACCFRYHKGTDFQANHNQLKQEDLLISVVLDTTKVQIFKQITTGGKSLEEVLKLFQIPQRYRFSSKSQQQVCYAIRWYGCFRYHKGTDFQANHNNLLTIQITYLVVLDTTKVQIFKQITTSSKQESNTLLLFQIPQRYRFSSKSQHGLVTSAQLQCCFRYHKGTDFQANHNTSQQ